MQLLLDRYRDQVADAVIEAVWILCLYFMGLNLSNDQIAHELDVNRGDVH